MQLKNIVSMALLTSITTTCMAAPLPAVSTNEVDVVKDDAAASTDAATHGKKKKGKKVDWGIRTNPNKPGGCLDWVIIAKTMGYCRLWEDIMVEEPDESKRDVTAGNAGEKSVFDMAMPYWAVAAL